MLKVGGRDVLHPARQVGGYVRYLIDWGLTELKLDVGGIAYLHAASPDLRNGAAKPSTQLIKVAAAEVRDGNGSDC
uniref:hypothetical protein n=1 Tax=Streptomyces asiaticus TaxID=114695 RepID=UPI00374CEDFB